MEEEEYLLQSLTKLVGRLEAVRGSGPICHSIGEIVLIFVSYGLFYLAECRALLPHMLALSKEHAGEADDLQDEVAGLEAAMRGSIERIWTEREVDPSDHLEVADGPSQVKLIDKVPKPSISDVPWKVGWIGAGK